LSEWWIFLKPRYDVWFPIFNFLSIHSKCFKGNENEENFWFDDPSNASMEEAVTGKPTMKHSEKMSWKKRRDRREIHEDRREIQAIPWKIQEGR
jgi:hypothetical protein